MRILLGLFVFALACNYPESIAVTVDYDEMISGATYQASGSFEVLLCD